MLAKLLGMLQSDPMGQLGKQCDVVTKGYLDVNLAIIGPQTLQTGPLHKLGGGTHFPINLSVCCLWTQSCLTAFTPW